MSARRLAVTQVALLTGWHPNGWHRGAETPPWTARMGRWQPSSNRRQLCVAGCEEQLLSSNPRIAEFFMTLTGTLSPCRPRTTTPARRTAQSHRALSSDAAGPCGVGACAAMRPMSSPRSCRTGHFSNLPFPPANEDLSAISNDTERGNCAHHTSIPIYDTSSLPRAMGTGSRKTTSTPWLNLSLWISPSPTL